MDTKESPTDGLEKPLSLVEESVRRADGLDDRDAADAVDHYVGRSVMSIKFLKLVKDEDARRAFFEAAPDNERLYQKAMEEFARFERHLRSRSRAGVEPEINEDDRKTILLIDFFPLSHFYEEIQQAIDEFEKTQGPLLGPSVEEEIRAQAVQDLIRSSRESIDHQKLLERFRIAAFTDEGDGEE